MPTHSKCQGRTLGGTTWVAPSIQPALSRGFLKLLGEDCPLLQPPRCPTPAARPAPGHSWPCSPQLGDWSHTWESGFMERAAFGPLGLGKGLGQNLIWVGFQLHRPLAVGPGVSSSASVPHCPCLPGCREALTAIMSSPCSVKVAPDERGCSQKGSSGRASPAVGACSTAPGHLDLQLGRGTQSSVSPEGFVQDAPTSSKAQTSHSGRTSHTSLSPGSRPCSYSHLAGTVMRTRAQQPSHAQGEGVRSPSTFTFMMPGQKLLNLHFTERETGSERGSNLPDITQLESDGAEI